MHRLALPKDHELRPPPRSQLCNVRPGDTLREQVVCGVDLISDAASIFTVIALSLCLRLIFPDVAIPFGLLFLGATSGNRPRWYT